MEPTPNRSPAIRVGAPCGYAVREQPREGRRVTPVKEMAMRLIGIPGQDQRVPCASCHHGWDVNYLHDLGRHRLRAEGFAAIVFDDGAILVNWCPRCDVPVVSRLPVHAQQRAAA